MIFNLRVCFGPLTLFHQSFPGSVSSTSSQRIQLQTLFFLFWMEQIHSETQYRKHGYEQWSIYSKWAKPWTLKHRNSNASAIGVCDASVMIMWHAGADGKCWFRLRMPSRNVLIIVIHLHRGRLGLSGWEWHINKNSIFHSEKHTKRRLENRLTMNIMFSEKLV